jgi:hypothetical protein
MDFGVAGTLFSLFRGVVQQGPFRSLSYTVRCYGGVATVFRHDIGVFCVVSGALTVLLAGGAKGAIKFFAAAIPIPVIVFGMLILKGAGMDMWNSLIGFGSVHARTAALAFPRRVLTHARYFMKAFISLRPISIISFDHIRARGILLVA